MNKIKTACWAGFITLFLLVGIFHQNILSFFYQKGVQAYAYSHFGCRLKYKNAFLKDGRLTLISPHLNCENGFQANQMSLSWDFDLAKREFEISIDLDKPKWIVSSSSNLNENGLNTVLKGKKNRLKLFYHVSIQDGTLAWILPDGTEDQLSFNAQASSLSGGSLKAFFREDSIDAHYLSIATATDSDALVLNWDCQGIECQKLTSLIKLFAPTIIPLNIHSGSIFGELKTVFPHQQRPYLEGELSLENIHFEQPAAYVGSIEKALLLFQKNPLANQDLTTIAEIHLIEPLSICSQEPDWQIDHLLGDIKFDGLKNVLINLDFSEQQLNYKVLGNINLNARRHFNFDLKLHSSSPNQPRGQIALSVHQQDQQKNVEIFLDTITHLEVKFLQNLISNFWPSVHNIEFLKGDFNASLKFSLSNEGLNNLQFDRFDINNADFKIHSHHSKGSFDRLSMIGTIDLKHEDPWSLFDGKLELENGRLQLEDLHHELPITDIQAHVEIEKGEINQSLVTLKWMGLNGSLDLEWGRSKELLVLNLDGHVHDVSNFFPEPIRKGLDKSFRNTRLKILANFKKQQQFELNGTIHVQRDQMEKFDLIHFGCEFIKTKQENQIKWIPSGRFYAHDLPLDKFLSPFLFRRGDLKLYGNGEFKGSFDQNFLTIQYNAQNLQIENENLLIDFKEVQHPSSGQFAGFHQINLLDFTHSGTLPVRSGTYHEKNTGLLFKDIQGTFHFKNKTLTLHEMESHCEGIFLAGKLGLDYSDPAPGVFSVMFDLPEISGKVSQIQTILSHLKKKTIFIDIPLEGDISTRNQGMQLVFDFVPQDYGLKANVEASIIDGSLKLEEADMALKGLYVDIDYDHQEQTLDISEIQGALLVGKPSRLEEYLFGGNHIKLKGPDLENVDLDIGVKDNSNELVRIIAKTEEIGPNKKNIILDPRSHVSSIYPNTFNCHLNNWTEISSFELTSNFELQDFINDLLLFRQTGLYLFSHSMLEKLSQIDYLKGQIGIDIRKDGVEDYFRYIVDAKQVYGPSNVEHDFYFKGYKRDKKWIIDHLQWNDISAHAEILPDVDRLKIPFLGIKNGRSLLLGLEGEILPDQGRLECQINLYEISLADLNEWKILQDFIAEWHPKGQMKGTGRLNVQFSPKSPWYTLDVKLDANLQNFTCKEYPFESPTPFQIDYQTEKGIKIQNALLAINSEKNAQINIGKLCFEPNQNQVSCSELDFNIPTTELSQVGDTLQQLFPALVSEQVKDILTNIKSEGILKGSIGFEKGFGKDFFSLRLDEGLYTFNQKNYQFEHFQITLDNKNLLFSALAHEEQCPYHIKGKIDWPSLSNGEATLTDIPSNEEGLIPPLQVKWSYNATCGLSLHSLQGYFCGLYSNLIQGSTSSLQGQIDVDFNRLRPLLTSAKADTITNLNLGSLFSFQGSFGLDLTQNQPLLSNLYFQGNLSGNEVVIKGFKAQNLHAELKFVPKQLEIVSFVIDDPAGRFETDRMVLQQSQQTDSWWLSAPYMTVKNLRPSLLRDAVESTEQGSSRYKNLLIKRIDLQNFYGNMNEVRTWQAQGTLHFLNPTRKNAPHPLLAIPAEIILRLGLNSQVLNPVTGTIYFDLRGDRFYFKRFKDIYSEGRGSKFYLAEGPTQSWMDLDGNLSLQIRMKQYNLLFKLAELFTVSVEGNIKKPKFYLQKQSKPSRKERDEPDFFD